MASATRYQALPVASDEIERRSLAVSTISSEDDTIRPTTGSAVSSDHEPSILSPNTRSLENEASLSPLYPSSKRVPGVDGYLVNGEDITSVPSRDEGGGTKDPLTARINF